MKKILSVLSLVIVALLAVSIVSAVPSIVESKLDGDELDAKSTGNFLDLDRGNAGTLKVEVKGDAALDYEDLVITAEILGYEHGDVERLYATSDVFKLKAGVTHRESLKFNFPKRLEADKYTLTVRVGGRDGTLATATYELDVTGKRHELAIDDVVFSPAFNVEAGRALLATVRVENFGEKTEDGVKVSLTIPSLNVGDAKYIDEVEEEEEVTSEELFVRIPACAAPGDYKATVTLTFNDGYDSESKDYTVTVGDGGLCSVSQPTQEAVSAGKTIITVAGEAQDVVKGTSGAVYPLTLTNTGSAAKTYTVSATAGDWANVQVSPSNVVVLSGGESKLVFVHVAASGAAATGEQVFSVAVKSGETTLKELVLKANVAAGKEVGVSKVKRGLEVGLVVLVVLLVILGLVIGFNRLKESGNEEEGQTYY